MLTEAAAAAGFTVILFEVVTAGLAQPREVVISTLTTSPAFSAAVLKMLPTAPFATPFTFQIYDATPPFTGVAVNVVAKPGQTGVWSDAMETEVVNPPALATEIVVFAVAVAGEAQLALEVRVTPTTEPLDKAEVTKVAELEPVGMPLMVQA